MKVREIEEKAEKERKEVKGRSWNGRKEGRRKGWNRSSSKTPRRRWGRP